MARRVLSLRGIAAVSTLPLLILGCSSPATKSAPASSSPVSSASGASVAPLAGPLPVPAAPAAPVCGDPLTMSTRDKLAQLLMVGVRNAADARAVVSNYHVGGIFIGSWTDLSMLTDGSLPDIANAGPLPLAVSVDEEGGRVARLTSLIGAAPSARVLAQTKTPDEVYQLALDRGRQMRGLGITVDFAPVVDVTAAAADTVIGDRSFSNDPAVVTAYAGAYARGLRDAGLLPVLKHFPGHGHGSGDSHTAGAVTTPPLADLQANDLIPYRTLAAEAPVAVMIGHLEVPGLTNGVPASLSPAAVGLLRSGNYGGPPFNGIVFTDDLSSMAAISSHYGVAEAVLRALQAGADVGLWVTTDEVPAVLDRLESAVNGGELSLPAIDASVLRLAGLKGPSPRCGG
ncbi:glycoside hydrolase family 3 protein [Mycobacterium sp. NBC_00419]|uniref:glycoside hydrolase family 3 N-terminal domain-containing protein n=1 Tax=Mycobacterium sp. NBC_00419 TaxID=2975989 RepID=UPI002E1EF91F